MCQPCASGESQRIDVDGKTAQVIVEARKMGTLSYAKGLAETAARIRVAHELFLQNLWVLGTYWLLGLAAQSVAQGKLLARGGSKRMG